MGMLLRVVDEGEVRSPMETRVDNLEEIKGILEESYYENSSNRLDRISNDGDYSIHAWGIEDKEVYGEMMDGDPLMVAVGNGDEPSDYEIKYVTELEFCLHEDVCEDCGEEVAEAIGFGGGRKYIAFSTFPPVGVSEVSGGENTLEYLQEHLLDDGDEYVEDDEINEGGRPAEKLVNLSTGLDSSEVTIGAGQKENGVTVWNIGTGNNDDEDLYWDGNDHETFPESDVAYAGGNDQDNLAGRFEDINIGDIIIAVKNRIVHNKPKILGFGVVQSESYDGWDKKEQNGRVPIEGDIYPNNEFVVTVDWLVYNFGNDRHGDGQGLPIEQTMEGDEEGKWVFIRGSLSTCDIRNQSNKQKYEYLKDIVANANDELDIELIDEKAKQKKALHQKLKEHKMTYNDNKEYLELLDDEKQVLFYGPPGTGKTYTAEKIKELGEELGEYEETEFVTFHPSYSYEEFVQGIRPVTGGTENTDEDDDSDENDSGNGELSYEVQPGVFKELCEDAARDTDDNNNYLLIIDEINRGNISSIFGELITLLEPDKRGEDGITVTLPYSEEQDDESSGSEEGDDDVWKDGFYVPGNLHIIGTMNTADRSIAKVDVALRRRFQHVPFEPDIAEFAEEEDVIDDDSDMNVADAIKNLRDSLGSDDDPHDMVVHSALAIEEINRRLMDKYGIEAGKKIGHSYMMDVDDADEVVTTWKYEILPLLNEYFFDDYDDIAEVLDDRDEGNVVDTDMKKFDFDDGDLEKVIKNLSNSHDEE